MGLMIVMFVVGAAAAPGYYMFRSGGEPRDSWLIGMLMILAGPLLIMTLISIVVALAGHFRRGSARERSIDSGEARLANPAATAIQANTRRHFRFIRREPQLPPAVWFRVLAARR